MATQSIAPLRVQKGTNSNTTSPSKAAFLQSRPLSELSPMALRRNSPSFPRNSLSNKHESSPTSSPFGVSNDSPRVFWTAKNGPSPGAENRSPYEPPASPTKRSSIENLKRQSRVKNSNIFELEQKNNYNPSQPKILDGRPLSTSVTGNAYRSSINSLVTKSPLVDSTSLEMRSSSVIKTVEDSSASYFNPISTLSPSKNSTSPTKSSLSKKTGAKLRRSGFDPSTGIWEDNDDEEKVLPIGKELRRHAKSVTFNEEPPQVNEYEMATPDPSTIASESREGSYDLSDEEHDDSGFERGSSIDVDDSFDASLEDTDKTPVVLPDDWRFMTPETANSELAQKEDDVFQDHEIGSPAPTARPGSSASRPIQSSTASVDSNGQTRPLPPLPPKAPTDTTIDSLSDTFERLSGSHRALPTPPQQATILSKDDIRRMSNGMLALEDRLLLLQVRDSNGQSELDLQRERKLRRASSQEASPQREQVQCEEPQQQMTNPEPAVRVSSTQISRASIMQALRDEDDISRSGSQRSVYSQVSYDPDVAIPSREDPTQTFEDEEELSEIEIKQEPIDDDELYAIPDMYSRKSSAEGSQYSTNSSIQHSTLEVTAAQLTPRAVSPIPENNAFSSSGSLSLPDFGDFGRKSSFDFGIGPVVQSSHYPEKDTTSASFVEPAVENLPNLAALREEITRPFTPELLPPRPQFASSEEESEPGTPSSVIHHPIREAVSPLPDHEDVIPEHARSISPPAVPPKSISPELTRFESNTSQSVQYEEDVAHDFQEREDIPVPTEVAPSHREGKRVSSLMQLDFPRDTSGDNLGLSLETAFDQVLETQKRGYLMRQNTKVVVATERTSHEDTRAQQALPTLPTAEPNEVVSSPRNVSQPAWTAEPWNNKSRRKSLRLTGEDSSPRKGAAPPLPGQASALGAVTEDDLAEEEAEELDDGAERGRLFIKVVGVKDLQLPFPTRKPSARYLGTLANEVEDEKPQFTLTLDNGLHCVTTAWLDLAKSAPIGQEFELVVLTELEFQLTLQMKLEPPKDLYRSDSPTKMPVSPKKQSTFGRLFGSPRKKKESISEPIEPQQRRPVTPPSAYELVQGLVSQDGSFARAYVSLTEFEKQAFGRPFTVDIGCFNEWAMEQVNVGSARSKKGAIQLQRRPPYEIGKLELQLLYVPKPKGAKDEDMPKSMNGAIRALRDAEEKMKQQAEIKDFEGFLSQQGGDCPYWRRRFFKLSGTKFTAYHETSRQPRATINLAKAAKLIDGKANLTQKEVSSRGGKRRKSAFADDEEGYMFVEEGFRLKFANGETIDFYAENAIAKEEWTAALSQVIGKSIPSASSQGKGWTDLVLRREKSLAGKPKQKTSKPAREVREKATPAPPAVAPAARAPNPEAQQQTQEQYLTPAIPVQQTTLPAPRPQGHQRGQSIQSGTQSKPTSPVKPRVSAADRHRKTMSMFM